MDTQPKIPTLKDSQKPQVKIRGLEAGVTLFDRLKQFKKKDLAFILAGLGTLFMAPLAEHFMMSPETGSGTLQEGWGGGKGGAGGIFTGNGASPYEPGTTGLAPGSAIGGGSDIITPLNVRDPSSLVMGPGTTQQPPTNSVMPPSPMPNAAASRSDSDLKDALAATSRGVAAAAHAAKALLPVPKIALSGSGGLRGLGVVSGGTSAVAGGPISSGNLVSGRAANNGSMPGVRGGSNIKAVTRSATGGGDGALEALKKAGDAASGSFNRGSASQGLNDAANAAIPTNTGGPLGGGGAGGTVANDKATGGDANKDAKNVGESLDFLKQKAMQEAQIALWAKEQEAGDNKLEALKIRNSMAESVAGAIGSGIGGWISSCFPQSGGPAACFSGMPVAYTCTQTVGDKPITIYTASVSAGGVGGCQGTNATSAGGAGGGSNNKNYYAVNYNFSTLYDCPPGVGGPYHDCSGPPGASKGNGSGNGSGVHDIGNGVVTDNGQQPQTGMEKACSDIKKLQDFLNSPSNAGPGAQAAANAADLKAAAGKFIPFQNFAAGIVAERDAIGGTPATTPAPDCNPKAISLKGGNTLFEEAGTAATTGLVGDLIGKGQILDTMDAQAVAKDNSGLSALQQRVIGDQKAVVSRINDFATDVNSVQSDNKTQTDNISGLTSTDPLRLTELQATFNRIKANPPANLITDATAAEETIRKSAGTIHSEIVNLAALAKAAQKQVQPLQDSFGDNGLSALIDRNGALAKAENSTTPPLTATPPASDEKLSPKDMPSDLAAAKSAIDTANATSPPTQAAIDAADKATRTAQADQKGIDDGIRSSVSQAAQRLGIGPQSAN